MLLKMLYTIESCLNASHQTFLLPIDQSNETKLVGPAVEKINNCGVFVHNLGIEHTAANCAWYSTLVRPVRVGLVVGLVNNFKSGYQTVKGVLHPYKMYNFSLREARFLTYKEIKYSLLDEIQEVSTIHPDWLLEQKDKQMKFLFYNVYIVIYRPLNHIIDLFCIIRGHARRKM